MVSEFSLITPQYGQKAICLHFPSMLIDCLPRHPCWWKFVSRNSWSVPTQKSRGTMAIKLGGPAFTKVDRAAGRCFSKLSLVCKGTQSVSALNWSGGHSARRPSSWRMGNQWSVITSGGSDSQAAAQGMNCSEVLMSSLEGIVPASNPMRLHLTWCTHLLSAVRVSYLFGRMSSIFTPLGRAASC